jgi:hypothetical protein
VALVVLDGVAGPHMLGADHSGEELDRTRCHGRTLVGERG